MVTFKGGLSGDGFERGRELRGERARAGALKAIFEGILQERPWIRKSQLRSFVFNIESFRENKKRKGKKNDFNMS